MSDNGYQQLFTLVYRQATVRETFIRARDLPTAIAVGRAWCQQDLSRKFISVRDPVVADEDILKWVEERDEKRKMSEDKYADLTVEGAKLAVEEGLITPTEAFNIEKEHRQRATLLNWLAAQVEV